MSNLLHLEIAGLPVGATASNVREAAILELLQQNGPVFLDPAAFSGVRFSRTTETMEVVAAMYKHHGYFCPTPRKGLIVRERCWGLISLLSELGEEDASADANDLADLLRSLAGVVVKHLGVSQLDDVGARPSYGLSSRLRRGPSGGGVGVDVFS